MGTLISEIKGVVSAKEKDGLTVMVGGFGLHVSTGPTLAANVRISDEVHLYTRLIVREDGWYLYGFLSKDQRNVFDLLLTVKGIGPKLAMGIVSKVKPEEFYQACIWQNEKVFSSVTGVGKKTAQRITLELRDRIGLSRKDGEKVGISGNVFDEAIEALEGLGYTWQEAKDALDMVKKDQGDLLEKPDLEVLLKEALKKLARI